ncbi:unnamed protein product [Urochloa decumbens]|uniref:Uncharacterized protein n=1 Tax=Urochloa decumbens TaxID=240449 RepID=A0ABC9E8M9_9POAL
MLKIPSSEPRYSCCSPGPSDNERTASEDYSGRIASPLRGEDETSDSERTASFGHIPSEEYGHVMEAVSGYGKAGAGDQDAQEIIREQGKRGLLKILSPTNNKLVRGISDGNVVPKNTKMDGETGSKILLTNTKVKTSDGMIPTKRGYLKLLNAEDKKMLAPQPRVKNKKEYLPLPQWLIKDYKSKVADLDGWQHMQVLRADGSERKDKYYIHRGYDHTFRSKIRVQIFIKTGEVEGKGLLQKKSADPSGQSSGSSRSTKRRMVVPASEPIETRQGFSWSARGDMAPNSSKLPHGFV